MNVDLPASVLSLCSGGGGLDLGLRLAVPGARTVCYVENEVTACGVLAARMEDERLDVAPVWTDLLTFDGSAWRGVVDWVIGGYPCQPFSNAGKRLGADDPRHLWPAVQRIVAEVRPEFCFFENVGAHLRLGGHEVIRSLQGMGYRTAATLLTASEVGAPHGRERLFILAHRYQSGLEGGTRGGDDGTRGETERSLSGSRADVADAERSSGSTEPREQHQERAEVATGSGAVGDAESIGRGERRTEPAIRSGRDAATSAERAVGDSDIAGLEGRQRSIFSRGDELPAWPPGPSDTDAWKRVLELRPDLAPAVEPPVRGVADGLGRRLGRSDQLHILGNGVVPQQAAYALRLLLAEML